MASREEILAALRGRPVEPVGRPDRFRTPSRPEGRAERFAAAVLAAGGRVVEVAGAVDLERALESLPEYAAAGAVCSLVPGVGRSTVRMAEVGDPHELRDIDFAILPGEFGVAENGAVWVAGDRLKHPAVCFLAGHLALVLASGDLVDDMHQAYERLDFDRSGFGVFLAGPSKTADIEQALVIGAHGARSLTVFLLRG